MTGRKGEGAFDLWSIIHVAAGVGLGFFGFAWYIVVLVVVGYEVAEAALRRVKLKEGGLFEYESWPNVFADIALGLGGWAVTVWLRSIWMG